MRSCLNGATTMPYDIITDIKVSGEVSFEGIEIWLSKLHNFLNKGSKIEELINIIKKHDLKVASFCAIGGYMFLNPIEFNKKLKELERTLDLAYKLECNAIVICPDIPPPKLTQKEAIEIAGKTLKTLGDKCSQYNVKLGLEPLGMHPFVPDIKTALKILKVTSHEHIGLTLDTFHMYKSNVPINDIRLLSPKQIVIIHINDCEELPREKLTDANRLFPGEGIIPLTEFLKALKEIGYQGFLSVEIFRKEYWKLDPLTIAKKSKESLDRILRMINIS